MEAMIPISNVSITPLRALKDTKKAVRYWHTWPNTELEQSKSWEKIETLLGLPHKTIAVWHEACLRVLPRTCGWDISNITSAQRRPYVIAARYYKRGVATRVEQGSSSEPSLDWLRVYEICFTRDMARVSESKTAEWIIVDSSLLPHFGVNARSSLFLFETQGEESKSLTSLTLFLQEWQSRGRPMRWRVYGGGVLLDLCGFAASFVGASYTSVPTTLLAMIDASLGGKTAVNFPPFGKNLIGTFYLPTSIWIIPRFLMTLSRREYLSGGAECLKHAFLIGDKDLITQVVEALRSYQYKQLIVCLQQLVLFKAKIVRQDPNEQDTRMILNLGHTLGHALEALSQERNFDYQARLSHGEAVALGLLYILIMSHHLGYLPTLSYEFLITSLKKSSCVIDKKTLQHYLGISLESDSCWSQLICYLKQDKKQQRNSNVSIQWVLLKDLGKVVYSKQTGYLINVDYKTAKSCWIKLLTILN